MKYIWIVILIVFNGLWIVSTIFDIIRSIRECEKEDYESTWKMILDISEDIEDSSRICIFVNILVVFIASFIMWV
jgi:hypothetical protein